MDAYFYLISGVAAAFGTAFIISTRGMYYASPDTDNELMAYAAAQSHKWRWLSDVYKYCISKRKVAMKEWTIILLSIFQKIFRDKTTDRPYTVMTGLAVSICTVLIYLIGANYFNTTTGLIVALFYIISFWPWQVSLYGGHANMANLFFLLSVYGIQMSSEIALPHFILIATGGAFLGFCLFSSPSSQKYLIPVFTALFFNQYQDLLISHDIGKIINSLPINYLILPDIIIVSAFLFAYIIIMFIYKPVVRKMYCRQAPDFLNKVISDRDSFTLDYYIVHARKKIKIMMRRLFWILFSLLLITNLIPALALLIFVAGFSVIFFMITLPNIKEVIYEYFAFILDKKTHFRFYIAYLAKKGITINRYTRGAGLSWVPKLLWTFTPFHVALFIAVFIVGQYKSLIAGNITESMSLIVVAIIALSPIIWAEITKAPQASRLYSPGLITGLLLPAYVISGTVWTTYNLLILSSFGILTFAWNLWKFSDDVYPSRMTVRNFMRIVRQLGINDIYTYQTSFNNFLVNAIPGIGKPEYLPKRDVVPPFRIHYIQRLDEVVDGWIVIPGKNSLEVTTAGESVSDDYTKDPILNRLIETKQMDKIAIAKLKTYMTSTIWINEDDITSYFALHLKYIGPDERSRGYAWLLHSSKIKDLIAEYGK